MSCENSRNWLLHSLMEKSAFILIRYVMEDMYRYYFPLPGMCSFNTKTKQDQSRDKLTILRNCFPAGPLKLVSEHHLTNITCWDNKPPVTQQRHPPHPILTSSPGRSRLATSMALFPSSASLSDSPSLHKLIGPHGKMEGKRSCWEQ